MSRRDRPARQTLVPKDINYRRVEFECRWKSERRETPVPSGDPGTRSHQDFTFTKYSGPVRSKPSVLGLLCMRCEDRWCTCQDLPTAMSRTLHGVLVCDTDTTRVVTGTIVWDTTERRKDRVRGT